MAVLRNNAGDPARNQQVIEALARENQTSVDHVRELFENEHRRRNPSSREDVRLLLRRAGPRVLRMKLPTLTVGLLPFLRADYCALVFGPTPQHLSRTTGRRRTRRPVATALRRTFPVDASVSVVYVRIRPPLARRASGRSDLRSNRACDAPAVHREVSRSMSVRRAPARADLRIERKAAALTNRKIFAIRPQLDAVVHGCKSRRQRRAGSTARRAARRTSS